MVPVGDEDDNAAENLETGPWEKRQMFGCVDRSSRRKPTNDNLRPHERTVAAESALVRDLAFLLRSWSDTASVVALRCSDDADLIEALADQIRRVAEKLEAIAWHADLTDVRS